MIDYKLRQEIGGLIVCLYDSASPAHFSTESLVDYVNGCAWQIMNGQRATRIPFHLSPVPADASAAIEQMNRELQTKRREEREESDDSLREKATAQQTSPLTSADDPQGEI